MSEAISIRQVMQIAGCDRRTVERRIKSGVYEAKQFPSEKQNGKTFTKVLAVSLPTPLQAKLIESKSTPLPASPHESGGDSQIPPAPFVEVPFQGMKVNEFDTTRGANISFGTGLQGKNKEKTFTPTGHESAGGGITSNSSDLGAWYQSLKPEHLILIEKRLDIIEGIGRIIEASKEKNKTQLIIELCENFRISKHSYYRWKKSYDKYGLYGLRVKSFGSSRSKLNEAQRRFIPALLRFNPDCRDARIWEYLVDDYPGNIVSGTTVSRFVRQWKKENPDLMEHFRNPDKWKSKYALAFGSQSEKAHHFLHYVELDSTPADVMCNDGKRYTIIGGIDIFSRKPKCYVSPSSSGMGVAALIRSIITDWGVPEIFVRDNGKDYICNQINLALKTLGIKAITVPPFSPEKKPHIERFFRTMSMCLFEELDGYIGHNVAGRKAIESRRTFAKRLMKQGAEPVRLNLNPEDLQSLIDRWIENIYEHKYHDGIGTPPENKAAQSTVPVRKLESERALDILLLPCGERTIQAAGISYDKARYRSPLFAGWVGKRVNVRRDIDNAGLLYVFDMGHNFICTAMDSRIDGMTEADFKSVQKEQKRILKEQVNAIEVLTESPMERRLKKAKGGKKLISLNRITVHSTRALEEAQNAALERNGIQSPKYKTVREQMNDGEAFDPDFYDNDPLAFMENLNIVNR